MRDKRPWRWRLADKLTLLPSTCWADLVSWSERSPGHTLRGCFHARRCVAEADACPHGCCYCGKFKRDRSADTDTTDDCGSSFVALFLAALGSWLAKRKRR